MGNSFFFNGMRRLKLFNYSFFLEANGKDWIFDNLFGYNLRSPEVR